MLNQLRNSYKFWNHPIFTKPKGAIRPPQKGTISYKQASHFRDFAISYFSSDPIDANEIRLRKPPDGVADVTSIISHPFEGLKIAAENKEPFEKPYMQLIKRLPVCLQYRFLAYQMKNKEYDKLIISIEKLINTIEFPSTIILPMYGYILSICRGIESEEIKFTQFVEDVTVDPIDQKHFYHLLDELCALSNTENNYPSLLHLFIGDVNDVSAAFSSTPHNIPILTTNLLVFSLRTHTARRVVDNLIYTRYQAALKMPELIPTNDEINQNERNKK